MPNFRFFPDFILLGVSILAQTALTWLLYRAPGIGGSPLRRRLLWVFTGANYILFTLGYLMVFGRVARRMPLEWATWLQGVSLIWAMLIAGFCAGVLLWKLLARVTRTAVPAAETPSPRRMFLQAAGGALFAAPVAATAFGIVRRNRVRLAEIEIGIPNLHKDLEGLRIVQITDIHLSAFLSEADLAHVIGTANDTRAHLALMTGDLITTFGDPLDACLRQLARLRTDAGGLGCLGNHEMYTGTEKYVTARGERIGIEFLRNENRELRFGDASLNFAGVDYQRTGRPYLIGAEELVVPGKMNILLSHNPDVFPVAARQGYGLTIAGHTHGGQVNVEILNDNINLARYYTPYTRGLYRQGEAQVFVSSGVGTVGMPVRLGAPAEINLIRLARSV